MLRLYQFVRLIRFPPSAAPAYGTLFLLLGTRNDAAGERRAAY